MNKKNTTIELHTFGDKNTERMYITFNNDISASIKYHIGDIVLPLLNQRPFFNLTQENLLYMFGEDWIIHLNKIKKSIDIRNEPIDPFVKNEMIGGNLYRYTVEDFPKAPKGGTFKRFDSLEDFLSFEFASVELSGHPIQCCEFCGCYFTQEKSNQICCGAVECKKQKNKVVRKARECTSLFKSKRNAIDRIIKKYGRDSDEYCLFLDEFDKNKMVMSEPKLIEWCNNQHRIRAVNKSTLNQQLPEKSNTI